MRAFIRMCLGCALLPLAAGCSTKPQVCRGIASAEAVAAAAPVVAAFHRHLGSRSPNTEAGRYMANFNNYDLAITSSSDEFDYEFVLRDRGHGYKGGGAYYRVKRETGTIEEERFEK